MAENPPSSQARKALLKDAQDAEPAPVSTKRKQPVAVVRQPAPAPVVKGISWGAFIAVSVVQLGLLAGALVWGSGYVSQKVTNARIGGSNGATQPEENGGAWKVALDQAKAQISALQRQVDAQNEEREKTQGRLQEMADRMALIIKQSSFLPTADSARVTEKDASQVAAMLPNVSPATSELVLIKERNRLTTYADQAIATGSREALQALVEAMADPAMKHLIHAAQAEFKRVQAYYDMGIGIDPGYTLPVREIFKDTPVTREADLTPAQLQGLMQDQKQPWEARLRAAFLLRSSTEAGTNALLLKALKEDPVLDVAKQAQITFENRVGRKFRLFDIPAIEAWWQAQGGEKQSVKMIEPGK